MTGSAVLKTPDEWCAETGITVWNPDGWNLPRDQRPWTEPISLDEFDRRVTHSSISMPVKPDPPIDRHSEEGDSSPGQ
jgi:hypothetical protein